MSEFGRLLSALRHIETIWVESSPPPGADGAPPQNLKLLKHAGAPGSLLDMWRSFDGGEYKLLFALMALAAIRSKTKKTNIAPYEHELWAFSDFELMTTDAALREMRAPHWPSNAVPFAEDGSGAVAFIGEIESTIFRPLVKIINFKQNELVEVCDDLDRLIKDTLVVANSVEVQNPFGDKPKLCIAGWCTPDLSEWEPVPPMPTT